MIRVPLSWLREYVAVEAPVDELAERLSVSTCEVERVVRRGVADSDGNLGHFLVGRVVEAGKHPNADKLQLCRVDVGEGEPRQIVCGAWNFGAGATVAVALPGAVMPDGLELKRAKLRGETSDGMILSERELELGTDHTGILVLEDGPAPGTPLADVLPLGEVVLECETTPNRPDLLSIYGMAREVAALFELPLAPTPEGQSLGTVPDDAPVDIRVEDLERCPVYIGRLFRDVKVGPSPAWLRARLVASGLRPISNVVDVTNYVMHALGNPLHAFDQTKLAEGRIVVRRARDGEELKTLDGNLRRLTSEDLVIADAEKAVAIAAIMGGLDSEVDESTTDVLLEAANFEPIGILRTSERLGLRTDGSNRWEKGVDPYLAEPAANLATRLIVELAGARWTGHNEVKGELPERPVIELRPERTSELLGLEVPAERQHAILGRLQFDVDPPRVTVPTWRLRDVTREIDLVEEVGRFVLDEVPLTLPSREVFGRLTREQKLRRLVEEALVGAGLSEAYTSSLVAEDPNPDAIRLPVPLSSEQAVLRTTLLPSLVAAARHNVDAGNHDLALYEIAVVYLPFGEKLPEERTRVTGIVQGDFFHAKGVVETLLEALKIEPRFERESSPPQLFHPGKTAKVEAGLVGELAPTVLEGAWSAFELDLGTLVAQAPELVVYQDVITHPGVRQDLAFAVDEAVPAGELIDAAREAGGPELSEIRVFDVYRGEQVGEGRKSIALAIVFRSPERTLSDEDAAALRDRIAKALSERFGAELRSG
ncbi:MAG: phenylalanine--tRNA ligase subunit beta [Actinomycetota bacterium]|nr:phenylalanine--tRNA ligase subunit beta [Actinomycetota bacterium]